MEVNGINVLLATQRRVNEQLKAETALEMVVAYNPNGMHIASWKAPASARTIRLVVKSSLQSAVLGIRLVGCIDGG